MAIDSFFTLEEIYEVMNKANERFDIKFDEVLFVSTYTPYAIKVHASFGKKGIISSAFYIYKLEKSNNSVYVDADTKRLKNDCAVLKECVIEKLNEKAGKER